MFVDIKKVFGPLSLSTHSLTLPEAQVLGVVLVFVPIPSGEDCSVMAQEFPL